MISLEDCLALCGLSEAEVLALAEHEHVPEMLAASLGHHLLGQTDGLAQIALAPQLLGALAQRIDFLRIGKCGTGEDRQERCK